MKEIELIDKFCEFLKEKKISYKREFRKGSYHNEGYVDVVLKIDGRFVAIEAKVNNFRAVYYQAGYCNLYFFLTYILYPTIPSSKSLGLLERSGIGLIIPKKNEFIVYKKPKWRKRYRNFKIKRNWTENRIGRHFELKELPKNYPKKKLDALLPTYDWTKKNRT